MVAVSRCLSSLAFLLGYGVGARIAKNKNKLVEADKASLDQSGDDASGRDRNLLAVLVRTGGPDSASRLESIRSTWGRDLEEDALTLLQADEECKSTYGDNHWRGLTCLEAKSHLSLMNRTDFDWLLVVDDDTFVFARRLQETLRSMDGGRAEVYGKPFCGDCGQGRKGFCGGGGYVLSRQSLLKMASATSAPVSRQSGEAFLEHMTSDPSSGWCDVRFGCVAQDKGLSLVGVKGMYGNGIVDSNDKTDVPEEAKVMQLRSQDPPLVFHKVRSDKHMQRLYQELLAEGQAAEGESAYSVDSHEGTVQWTFSG